MKHTFPFTLELRKPQHGAYLRWRTRGFSQELLFKGGVRREQRKLSSSRVQVSRATHFDKR